MYRYLIRREIDYYIVYDYELATLFSIALNSVHIKLEVGGQTVITDVNLWEFANTEPISFSESLSNSIVIGLQITDKCNLRCKYCIAKKDLKSLDFSQSNQNLIKGVIEKLNPMAVWISGGEPTLNNDLPQIISYIRKINTEVGIVIDTNGVSINDSIIDFAKQQNVHFRVSIDSHIPEIHNFTRGCFDKSLESLIKLKRAKISFGIITVVHNSNLNSLLGLSLFLEKHKIKRHTLLQLREGFVKSTDNLIITNYENANNILNELFQLNRTSKIFTTFIKGTINKSSIIISPSGELFTSNPSKGTKQKFYASINEITQCNWNDLINIDTRAHQSKYLGIINNYSQNAKIIFYQ